MSGWAEILKLLFWTNIFEILAKTLIQCAVLNQHRVQVTLHKVDKI